MPGGFPNLLGNAEPMQVDIPEENENDAGGSEETEVDITVQWKPFQPSFYCLTAGAELHRGEPQPRPGGHQQCLHRPGQALQASVHS